MNGLKMVGLREIRIKKGYTQMKVAMDLHITREALSYYENGKRNPDISLLVTFSNYYGKSIDYLITGKEFGEK
ncbi:helix-turn-helix domain-containing protein [Qingrenia yutianensis]|uniref:Helix-turn-helix transcriptional regulator n=1 Tax=Qingrenia yutianensis TaxID=2763676 RepID=A0A926IMX4_9FIRM|nr:helix-turn-helix transcriptional regulator [Qingrenia yutianensis]MBC8596517.1 helix-turn-helix transcriptional regulator [Qingrenia yutianensis]